MSDQEVSMVGVSWGSGEWGGLGLILGIFFCTTELMKNYEYLMCEGVICW